MTQIHPTALVDPLARLGEDVEIGPYCIVGPKVVLGDRCSLRSHVVIEGQTYIGHDNVFYQFSTIGSAPQDLKYHDEETSLHIGNHNTFREAVSVHRGTVTGRSETRIGDHNLFMGYVHVAHDCIIGNRNILANYTGLSGHVTIDDCVTLGGQNGVIQFVRIGSYCYFGAGTMVDKSIAPYTTGYGNRIQIKGVNVVGLERRGFSPEAVQRIREAHRLFFRSGVKTETALETLETKYGQEPEIRQFIDFIRAVKGNVKKRGRSSAE